MFQTSAAKIFQIWWNFLKSNWNSEKNSVVALSVVFRLFGGIFWIEMNFDRIFPWRSDPSFPQISKFKKFVEEKFVIVYFYKYCDMLQQLLRIFAIKRKDEM